VIFPGGDSAGAGGDGGAGFSGGFVESDSGTCGLHCAPEPISLRQCVQGPEFPDSGIDAGADASSNGPVNCNVSIDPVGRFINLVLLDCTPLDSESVAVDPLEGAVVLKGTACEALNAAGPHRIDVVLGCRLDS
jgi:hypothetical protein